MRSLSAPPSLKAKQRPLEGHSAAICIFAIDIVIIPMKNSLNAKNEKMAELMVVTVV
jgi:hypothetical protein